MKAQVYTLHIAYKDFEDKIWRTVEVSSKNTIAQLGYSDYLHVTGILISVTNFSVSFVMP